MTLFEIFYIHNLYYLFFSRELFPSTTEDEKSNELDHSSIIISDKEQGIENIYPNEIGDGNKLHIDKLIQNLNKKQKRILLREYERQGNNCCL